MLACWLARAINEEFLRLSLQSKLRFSGHYGRTWIDHDENGLGLLRNVIEE